MQTSDGDTAGRAAAMLRALGGRENVRAVTHCMTRLRLRLRDPAAADQAALCAAGAAGVLRRADGEWHVVIGVGVAALAREIERLLRPADGAAHQTTHPSSG